MTRRNRVHQVTSATIRRHGRRGRRGRRRRWVRGGCPAGWPRPVGPLLEAGPDRRGDLPEELRDGWTIERELFDWGYKSEPDPAHEPRPVRRKKVLGGTSWLTRFTPRGSPADYDGWDALGVDGWAFDDVLPYFIRLEHDLDFGHEAWHGDSGPLPSV